MYKVDLHTHSRASPDGGLRLSDYRRMLDSGRLAAVAITDHNTTEFAQTAQAELGQEVIIIGEEIMTMAGEIIGLYLKKTVPAGMTLGETVAAIRAQNGLVYVPHPFETLRHGLAKSDLDGITGKVDIVEIHNGRAVFQNRAQAAAAWVDKNHTAGSASSDAHGRIGWGRTGSLLPALPTRDTLLALLDEATYDYRTVQLGVMHPKLNRIKKQLGWHV